MLFSIVTNVISSIIYSGLIITSVSLARQFLANRLKDGDIGPEKLRDIIEGDLNLIKRKIDGLARKDLDTSYAFLKEGILSLNLALKEALNDGSNGAQNDGSNDTTATRTNESESRILNETIELSRAVQKLKSASNGRFVRAENCFADARREATRAFNNQALSLQDRIMAAQLRVMSKMLECLQDTKVAADTCMLFLEELHDLPGIGKSFSIYFGNPIKSIFYKKKRLTIIKSVLALNFAISEFIARFSDEVPDVRNWPRMHLFTRRETFHPLLLHIDVLNTIFEKDDFKLPENQVLIGYKCSCDVNSKGQLLVAYGTPSDWDGCIGIYDRLGTIELFCQYLNETPRVDCCGVLNSLRNCLCPLPWLLPESAESSMVLQELIIDRCDEVYVVFSDQSTSTVCAWDDTHITVFSSTGNQICDYIVPWAASDISCAVNKDDEILKYSCGDKCIYVIDKVHPSNIKSILRLERDFKSLECVTNEDEIVMCTEKYVFVLTKEGETKRTINVKKHIESVAFNHVTSKIEILVRNKDRRPSYSILSYSENDKVEYLCYLPVKSRNERVKFCLHPAGHAVLVYSKHAVFM